MPCAPRATDDFALSVYVLSSIGCGAVQGATLPRLGSKLILALFFAAGQFAGATDVVSRQAALSEAGVSGSQCSAAMLWDMSKFYESFNLTLLQQKAEQWGFPIHTSQASHWGL